MKFSFITLALTIFITASNSQEKLPEGFVYLLDIIPNVRVNLRYNTNDNFMGQNIDMYQSNKCITSVEAAQALQNVQNELMSEGYSLKIFDAYRPQQAVDHFVRWAKDLGDTTNKASYYPEVPKSELFERGYIAAKSGHSRGSTVDLTLIDAGR